MKRKDRVFLEHGEQTAEPGIKWSPAVV